MTSRRWLVAIVALGAVLRFFPIGFGLPYAQARPDETAALGLAVSVRSGDFNPHFFHRPSLAIYVFAIVHGALSWSRRAMNVSPDLSFGELVVTARAVVASAGTLTIIVLFSMARRMGGTAIGLLAALFLAVSVLHVRDSHLAMTDVLMTLLSTASLALLLRALDADTSGRIRPSMWFAISGFVGGLATSTKYSAAALVAALTAAAFVGGAFAAAFYGSIGSGQTVFFRYVLPLIPILCLPAAVATTRVAAWLAARTGFRSLSVLRGLTLTMAGVGLVNCAWFDILLSRTDSRVLAAEWLAPRLRADDSLYDSGSAYTRLNLSQLRYQQWSFDAASESFGHPGGETPDWLVLYESPLTSYTRMPQSLLALARSRYHLLHSVVATTPHPRWAVYDLQDAFFMPVSGFDEVRRPGPTVRIYRRLDASSLLGNDEPRQSTPR